MSLIVTHYEISLSWTQDSKVRNVSCSLGDANLNVQRCYEWARSCAAKKRLGDPENRDRGTKMALYITS